MATAVKKPAITSPAAKKPAAAKAAPKAAVPKKAAPKAAPKKAAPQVKTNAKSKAAHKARVRAAGLWVIKNFREMLEKLAE